MEGLLLVRPDERYVAEISSYRSEYIGAGDIFNGAGGLEQYDDPIKWIEHCRSVEKEGTLPGPDWVPADQFMLIRESTGRILGMVNIRHRLNDHLAKFGGHV
ncbi:MAG: hypothetical protein LBI08_03805, partial [Methanomassiliicoccaceae archaeon]|nr:hypothetical protein [Methanomassiliicoccaceae archaeon]